MKVDNKLSKRSKQRQRGMTLIEISLVMAVLLAMSFVVFTSLKGMDRWKVGKKAGEELRVVYIAQKSYLADHPTTPVANLTQALLVPYLKEVANTETTIPPVANHPTGTLNIKVDVMPPVVVGTDPSGKTDDGLWDVGNP